MTITPDRLLVHGDLILNINTGAVTLAGSPVTLTMREYRILLLLFREQGSIVTKDELIQAVFGNGYAPEHVWVTMARLNKKVERHGSQHILCVRGCGYRLL